MKKILRDLMVGERLMWKGEEHRLTHHNVKAMLDGGPLIERLHDKQETLLRYDNPTTFEPVEVDLVPRCLSLWSPWAFAMMHLGKDVENRPLASSARGITGTVFIQASGWPGGGAPLKPKTASWHRFVEQYEAAALIWHGMSPENKVLPAEFEFEHCERSRGQIIGTVEITHYQEPDSPPDSPWYAEGQRAMMIRNPKPLSVFIPCGGQLGFWRIPSDVADMIQKVA